MKRSIALAVVALVFGACGESTDDPVAEQAKPSRFVAPDGAGTDCTQTQPCGTFEAAYKAAKPGELIEVAPGRYGAQLLPATGEAGPRIEFRGAGRGVRIDGLDIKADHVAVRAITSAYVNVDSGDPDDLVEDVRLFDVDTRTHFMRGVRDFLWQGGSIGPSHDAKASMIAGTPPSHRLIYDRVTWHDATRSDASIHTECLIALGVQGLTIRNSRFTNCAVLDILLSRIDQDPPPRDIVIENTVLEASRELGGKPAYFSVQTGADPIDGLTLRNNVWGNGISFQGPVTRGVITGNIGWAGPCVPGIEYSHNVFIDHACAPTDRVDAAAFSQFVDPGKGDWRLKPRAAAIDAADPTQAPRRDATGKARDQRPDAGAFEYRR